MPALGGGGGRSVVGGNPAGGKAPAAPKPAPASRPSGIGGMSIGTAAKQAPTRSATLASARVNRPAHMAAPSRAPLAPPKPPKLSKGTGASLPMGAIEGGRVLAAKQAIAAADPLGGLLARFAEGAVHAPLNLAEGAVTGAKAYGHDVEKAGGNPLAAAGNAIIGAVTGSKSSQLGYLTHQSIANDPIVQSIEQGSLKPMSQNPWQTFLDATGIYSGIGRAAGGLVRTAGELGSEGNILQRAGSTSRAPQVIAGRQLAPEQVWSSQEAMRAGAQDERAVLRGRRGSPNLIGRAVQATGDYLAPRMNELLGGKRVAAARAEQLLRRDQAAFHTREGGVEQAQVQNITRTMMKAKPGGRLIARNTLESKIAPWTTRFGLDSSSLAQAHENIAEELARNDLPKSDPRYQYASPETRAAAEEHMTNLRAAMSADAAGKLDWPALAKVRNAYDANQAPLEALKNKYDIETLDAMQAEEDKAQSIFHNPDQVFFLKEKAAHPDWLAAKADAKDLRDEAAGELANAQKQHLAVAQRYKQLISDTNRSIEKIPVHPANDNIVNDLIQRNEAYKVAQNRDLTLSSEHLKDLAERARSTQSHYNLINTHKQYLNPGAVITDTTKTPLRDGKLATGASAKDMQVRELTHEDARALQGDRPPGSFMHMTNPDHARSLPMDEMMGGIKTRLGRPHPREEVNTGEAARAGDFPAHYGAMIRSQLTDVHSIAQARYEQNFINRYSTAHYESEAAAKDAANLQHAHDGIRYTTLHYGDQYHVVPTAAVDEAAAQIRADNPGKSEEHFMHFTSAFRKTVLATSPKLPVMHTVESSVRSLLGQHGILNPVSLPSAVLDAFRGRAIVKAGRELDPEAAAGIERTTTPGGQAHMHTDVSGENLHTSVPVESKPIRQSAMAFVHGADRVATGIIHLQRSLEYPQNLSALGRESRMYLQSLGHSWLDTNMQVTKYARLVAEGMHDPQEAMQAARNLHDLAGQYNSWPASVRTSLRLLPFAPWYINAAKFVYFGLPKYSPLSNALLQDIATYQQPNWDQVHGGLPSYAAPLLMTGPQTPGGAVPGVDISKFGPGGSDFSAGSILATGASLIAPQVSGPALALVGLDPYGKPLQNAASALQSYNKYAKGAGPPPAEGGILSGDIPTTVNAALAALDSLIGETAGPVKDIARGLEGKGGTFYSDSTPILNLAGIGNGVQVKPGSAEGRGRLDFLNPFNPTYVFPSKTNITAYNKAHPGKPSPYKPPPSTAKKKSSGGGIYGGGGGSGIY